MWPFLLVLAIVPMIFFWSDSVREVLPDLSSYLPDKTSTVQVEAGAASAPVLDAAQGSADRWTQSSGPEGFAAWVLSADYQYRITVGCRTGERAAMQLTLRSGKPLPPLTVRYPYGELPLADNGFYTGSDVVSATAQFSQVYVLQPGQPDNAPALTTFNVPLVESGLVARALSQNCR